MLPQPSCQALPCLVASASDRFNLSSTQLCPGTPVQWDRQWLSICLVSANSSPSLSLLGEWLCFPHCSFCSRWKLLSHPFFFFLWLPLWLLLSCSIVVILPSKASAIRPGLWLVVISHCLSLLSVCSGIYRKVMTKHCWGWVDIRNWKVLRMNN